MQKKSRKEEKSRRDKELPMLLAKFYEDLYEGEDDYVGEDVMMGAECEDEETEQSVKIKRVHN